MLSHVHSRKSLSSPGFPISRLRVHSTKAQTSKDMLCYLELIVGDNLDAFKRVYNRPNRFLGKVFFEQFEQKFKKRPFVTDCLREQYSKSNMMKAASGFAMELMILRRNAKEMNPGKAIALVRKVC